jgi:hypothetical protein
MAKFLSQAQMISTTKIREIYKVNPPPFLANGKVNV